MQRFITSIRMAIVINVKSTHVEINGCTIKRIRSSTEIKQWCSHGNLKLLVQIRLEEGNHSKVKINKFLHTNNLRKRS